MRRPRAAIKDHVGAKAPLYDRLERALIALEYALADARAYESARAFARIDRIARAHWGEDDAALDALLALQTAALHSAARRAAQWY